MAIVRATSASAVGATVHRRPPAAAAELATKPNGSWRRVADQLGVAVSPNSTAV